MLYKDTDTRVTRGGRTRRSSKNSICFFYPPLPFHLSSSSNHITAPFPSLLSSHRAGSTEARPERQSSSLHPRPAFASSPACECEQEPLRSAWARVSLQRECDRRLPSSSFLQRCGSGVWHSSTAPLHSKQSKAISRCRPYHETPTAAFPFPFV